MYREERAWDALYETAKAYKGELKLIATGPLTNIAIALGKYPDLPEYLPEILIMGGSAAFGGKRHPGGGIQYLCGPGGGGRRLQIRDARGDVRPGCDHAGIFYPGGPGRAGGGRHGGRPLHQGLPEQGHESLTQFGLPGVAMHDSCPVVYLVHPEYFEAEEAGVYVETRGSITNGKNRYRPLQRQAV